MRPDPGLVSVVNPTGRSTTQACRVNLPGPADGLNLVDEGGLPVPVLGVIPLGDKDVEVEFLAQEVPAARLALSIASPIPSVRRRLMPMNCISWNVGHLAWQEQRYFLYFGQGQMPYPEVQKAFAYGAPGSTPTLRQVLGYWRKITALAFVR